MTVLSLERKGTLLGQPMLPRLLVPSTKTLLEAPVGMEFIVLVLF
jgi:hypothetical protein